MLEPSIGLLREKADSRYSLVIMAAKRARDLVDGKPSLLSDSETLNVTKPVTIAVNEIAGDLITYKKMTEEELVKAEEEE